MVKLIASDIDGTLLQGDHSAISDKALDLIGKLCDLGVYFAPASGRQYASLHKLFEPVADKLVYICSNGAYVKYKDEVIYKSVIERDKGIRLLEDILHRDGCEFILDGSEYSYLCTDDKEFISYVENHIKNKFKLVTDINDIDEDFVKISVYQRAGIELSSTYFEDKWSKEFKTTVSGKCFMDFVNLDVNKGMALEKIRQRFKVETDFTMCFGDNYNDLEMFDVAYFSYAMTGADPYIRSKARYLTPNVESILYDVFKILE